MGLSQTVLDMILSFVLSFYFLLSLLSFIEIFHIREKLDLLLLKIQQLKSLINHNPDINPNIKKTLLKQLGEDNFSIIVDKTSHFPYKEVFISSNDILHYSVMACEINSYVLASEINSYVLGSKINIFFFCSSLWTI
jgi:hypothetical protein